MTITVGTDSHISLADANAYFATRYNSSAWDAFSDADKEILLKSGTRSVDVYCAWSGYKTDDDQALEFPRDGDTEAPVNVQYATCEMALSISSENSVISTRNPGLVKLKADVVEFIFSDLKNSTNSLYNDLITRFLSPYCSGLSSGAKRMTRV